MSQRDLVLTPALPPFAVTLGELFTSLQTSFSASVEQGPGMLVAWCSNEDNMKQCNVLVELLLKVAQFITFILKYKHFKIII